MGSEAAFVAAIKHVGADTHGVADAEDGDSAEGELFANPVDSGVAGGADEDLCFALEGFDDGFDEGGGLAGAGRAVDDGYVLAGHDAVDGHLLMAIEPRQADMGYLERLGHGAAAVENLAELPHASLAREHYFI